MQRHSKPVDKRLSDNWGYVYGAVYTYYLCTGEGKYRDSVIRVLRSLPKYRNWNWEPSGDAKNPALGSFDGYADSIESAIYLFSRTRPGSRGMDRLGDAVCSTCSGRWPHRRLVWRREFQPDRHVVGADEEPGRAARRVETRHARRSCGQGGQAASLALECPRGQWSASIMPATAAY